MNNITVTESNLIKYIEKTNNEKLIKATNKLLLLNPNMLLKDYLTNLLKKYDTTCKYFYIFYEDLFLELKLYNFHRELFGLKL
jgi:hypothetical protein